ncbi:MAG TPA: hypothetical protein VIV11_25765 [Kofleriaceae bacterium]
MRTLIALLAIAACGGGSSSSPSKPAPRPGPTGPQLLGRPVAVTPLSPGEQTIFDRATASLAYTAPNLDGEPREWQAKLRGWIDQRVETLKELEAALRQLPTEQRKALFASIAGGVALDDFVADLLALPVPASLKAGEFAADVEAAYRDAIVAAALPVAGNAQVLLANCAELAPTAAESLRVWTEHCRTRAAALDKLVNNADARPKTAPVAKRPAVMKDCEGGEKIELEPDALPPDMKAKPKLLVTYADDQVSGADRDRLIAAVTKQLKTDSKLPLVSTKEVAAAEALVAQRKLTPKGPACGLAPRLTQVLAAKHRHLILAQIHTECIRNVDDKPDTCGLRVKFKRAGTWDNEDLPKTLYAPVDKRDAEAATWIAAANALVTGGPELAGILGSLIGTGPRMVSLKNYGDDDPWLRLGDTVWNAADKLEACADVAASFDVKLAISKTGLAGTPVLTPATAPPANTKVADCVRDVLKATPFPCTRDGKPAEVEFRVCVAPKP